MMLNYKNEQTECTHTLSERHGFIITPFQNIRVTYPCPNLVMLLLPKSKSILVISINPMRFLFNIPIFCSNNL